MAVLAAVIRSGDMRHVVRIEREVGTQDAAGQPIREWVTHAERRAAIERAPGREVWASAQRGGRVPVVFRLRYEEGVQPGMRLVNGQKVHDIISVVDPTGLMEELIVTAEERVEETP